MPRNLIGVGGWEVKKQTSAGRAEHWYGTTQHNTPERVRSEVCLSECDVIEAHVINTHGKPELSTRRMRRRGDCARGEAEHAAHETQR
jgi:hypothetical protein